MKKRDVTYTVLCCILIIMFCISVCPISMQNDTFYTIKIGEYIVQNGIGVLHNGTDPFSWHDGLPYTFPHWAYDVLIYGVYNLGGLVGICISTVVLACILGLSMFYINTKLIKNRLTSFIITIGAMYLMSGYIAARAQLVTFILFIWAIYFIEKYLETRKKKYAITLIIIPIIIANIHLAVWPFYFILFLPYIGEYVFAHLIETAHYFRNWRIKKLEKKILKGKLDEDKVRVLSEKIEEYKQREINSVNRKEEKKKNYSKIIIEKNKNVKGLIIIAIICIFTGLLTPLGDTPYTYLIHTMQGNTMESISEHLPLTLINSVDFMCLIVLFLAILILTDTKIRLRDLFMISGLLFMSFATRRQMSMFILIGSVILNRLVASFIEKRDPEGSSKMQGLMARVPGILITTLIIVLISAYMIKPKIGTSFINEKSYPVATADYILENVDIKNMKMYNDYNYGSYLLYRGIPVFIDSRADLYAPEFNGGKDIFSDFIKISSIGTYYEDKFKDYGITHVLVYKNSKLNMLLIRDKNYKKLYSDDNFYFYERTSNNE